QLLPKSGLDQRYQIGSDSRPSDVASSVHSASATPKPTVIRTTRYVCWRQKAGSCRTFKPARQKPRSPGDRRERRTSVPIRPVAAGHGRNPPSAGRQGGVIARTVTTPQPANWARRGSAPSATAAARNSNVVAARRIDIFILLQCAVSQYVSGCRAGAYGTMQAP